jgi:hypothetical protein
MPERSSSGRTRLLRGFVRRDETAVGMHDDIDLAVRGMPCEPAPKCVRACATCKGVVVADKEFDIDRRSEGHAWEAADGQRRKDAQDGNGSGYAPCVRLCCVIEHDAAAV